jgi:hypothetical protein
MEIKKIETYSLYEFCQAVQQSIIEGWRFDFESNDLFPTAFGSMLVTGMVKKPEIVAQEETEVQFQVIEEEFSVYAQDNQVKRGRKPKE